MIEEDHAMCWRAIKKQQVTGFNLDFSVIKMCTNIKLEISAEKPHVTLDHQDQETELCSYNNMIREGC